MRVNLSLIAGIAALVPALSFGQAPSIFELKDATKDAFESTAKALDTIEADSSKGKKSAGAKKRPTAAKAPAKQGNSSKASADQSKSSGTIFSKLAERANSPETKKATEEKRLSAAEQEKKVLSFLGSSSDMVYRVVFSIIGVALTFCVGMRIKERVKDVATGRPSLSRSRIIRR